jgi:hypothetical protein
VAGERPTEPGRRDDRSMWPWVLALLALLALVGWGVFSWWRGGGGERWQADEEVPKAAREAPDEPPPPPAPALALNAFTADCVSAEPPGEAGRAGAYAAACLDFAAETLRAAAGVRREPAAVATELDELDRRVRGLRQGAGAAAAEETDAMRAAEPPSPAAIAAAGRAAVAAVARLGTPQGETPLGEAAVAEARRAADAVAAADDADTLVLELHRFHRALRPLLRATVPGSPAAGS